MNGETLLLICHLQLVDGDDLFLGGRLRPRGRDLVPLQRAEPLARLVVQFLDGRRLVQELSGLPLVSICSVGSVPWFM